MPHRRQFLQGMAGLAAPGLLSGLWAGIASAADDISGLQLARFRFDVTPPLGHSLCGGWIKPATEITDPLEAIGLILLGHGKPIVICVVDWTGLLNSAHLAWRTALAEAAGTSVDRVAVHCVHQHNAPFACLDAEQLILAQGDLPHIVEIPFFERCLQAARQAVTAALPTAQPVTHIAQGSAKVDQVASNRRLIGLNGKVISQRGSSSRNPTHQRFPEGLIDPELKSVAFFQGDKKLAVCHYYACHPMSYYGDGAVSADFCGLARKRQQQAEPDCLQLYFNGCGGNIGAGKYNDGSRALREVLTSRIHTAMQASEQSLQPKPITQLQWTTSDLLPPVHNIFSATALQKLIGDPSQAVVTRNRNAYALAWIERMQQQIPLQISALHINDISLLHLPSESFIEYQLRAQATATDRFVACAAYGDGGPWYIPTADAYTQGGYAVSVAWCGPEMDGLLSGGIADLLAGATS